MKFSFKKASIHSVGAALFSILPAGLTWAVSRQWLGAEDAAFITAIVGGLASGFAANGVAFKWMANNTKEANPNPDLPS